MNGLGDRNRSPTPADAWEIMETTIEPDATLPSNQSSFATIPATNSFASTADTTITEPERGSASTSSHHRSASEDDEDEDSQGGSTSSADADELACIEEHVSDAESLARDMYYHEMQSPEGRARVARIQQQVNRRFSYDQTPSDVDIGFRLMDQAFDSREGRARVFAIHGEGAILRMARYRELGHRNSSRRRSPPPYETSITSHDPPTANPVSRALRDVSEVLLNDLDGDEQGIDHMRRVARRLAQREDVPDEWWMSMGLNSSIARPRREEDDEFEESVTQVAGDWPRSREQRLSRGDARL